MRPKSRPKLDKSEVLKMIRHIDRQKYPLVCLGIRGYYLDSMGQKGANDRGIYDDAIFLITPTDVLAFNGNTDPSQFRIGSGTGAKKGMASLKPGTWYVHQPALHSGKYLALCQRAGNVTVLRDGNPPYEHTGSFGINIHRGGNTTTGSLCCQTIPPDQWDEYIKAVSDCCEFLFPADWAEFIKQIKSGKNVIFRKLVVPYVLVEQTN